MTTESFAEPEVKQLSLEEQREAIMRQFDFAKVHRAMTALNWTWHRNGVKRVPTQDGIRDWAFHMLGEAMKKPGYTSRCGGFFVENMDGSLRLAFCIDFLQYYSGDGDVA